MEHTRIVITGVGVVAPNGIGKEAFWKNCLAGVSGIKPITLFDTSKYRCHHAGEISNFQPEQYLGSKGLRNLDRTTLLALVAAKLAIDDAKLEITDENRNDIGVVLGSTMGSVHSISEFDKEGLREGPRYVNPAKFPNTVINSPASQVAIWLGVRGMNSTISSGFTAGIDAINYGVDMLRIGRVKALLVGASEELCIQTFIAFEKLRLLRDSQMDQENSMKIAAQQNNGTFLGEGASFLCLESMENAMQRGATILGEIKACATSFTPASMHRRDPTASGPIGAAQSALAQAGITPEDISHLESFANGISAFNEAHQVMVERIFSCTEEQLSIGSVKTLLGELYSASGVIQVAAVLGSRAHVVSNSSIKVTTGSQNEEINLALRYYVLVCGLGLSGVSSALVLAINK